MVEGVNPYYETDKANEFNVLMNVLFDMIVSSRYPYIYIILH